MSLDADFSLSEFFGGFSPRWIYCIDFSSLSMITKREQISLKLSSLNFKNTFEHSTRCFLSSGVSIYAIHCALTFFMCKNECIIFPTRSLLIFKSIAICHILILRSCKTSCLTFTIFSSVTAVDGRPECSSSIVCLPFRKSWLQSWNMKGLILRKPQPILCKYFLVFYHSLWETWSQNGA